MLRDVHKGTPYPGDSSDEETLVQGSYQFCHYGCDGFDDKGWGCGYRTLQTLCSWVTLNHRARLPLVPSVRDVQAMLVDMGDKPPTFKNSRDWIGSIEASYVLGQLFDWDCRIVHVRSGDQLAAVTPVLRTHLAAGGGPVMAGGDLDCAAKCVVGVRGSHLLLLDPHFQGEPGDRGSLQRGGWVRYQHVDDFLSTSFYNLCLPLPLADLKKH